MQMERTHPKGPGPPSQPSNWRHSSRLIMPVPNRQDTSESSSVKTPDLIWGSFKSGSRTGQFLLFFGLLSRTSLWLTWSSYRTQVLECRPYSVGYSAICRWYRWWFEMFGSFSVVAVVGAADSAIWRSVSTGGGVEVECRSLSETLPLSGNEFFGWFLLGRCPEGARRRLKQRKMVAPMGVATAIFPFSSLFPLLPALPFRSIT